MDVVGGAIFSTVNQQGVESTSGFTGEDVMVVDQFGANSYGELEMVLRNGGAEEIELNEVRVSDGENEAVWKPAEERRELDVSGSQVATFLQVEEGGETDSLDVELNYDMGGLEDLESRGSITGSFDVIESSEFYDMDPFVLHVNSTRPGNTNDTQFRIGAGGGNINYQVEWESLEDSSEGEIIDPLTSHHTLNFDSPGMHRVEIRGLLPRPYQHGDSFDSRKIETLEAWGDIEYRSLAKSFKEARNMEVNYTDTPDLSRIRGGTSNSDGLKATFRAANNFNGTVQEWDVSNVENMQFTFFGTNFDGDLSEWDVSNVKNMGAMFRYSSYSGNNGDISGWDVSSVTKMDRMFNNQNEFDHNLSEWCVEQIDEEPVSFGLAEDLQPDWGASC